MGLGFQEIKERDAALVVMHNQPPDDKWFRAWEAWFIKQSGESKADTVRRIFHYARNGAAIETDAKGAAKAELAEMLESMARQIRQ